MQILFAEQVFDDLRAGGRRAETAAGHRGLEFFVVDHLTRAFHRREQRRFAVAGGRTGRRGGELDVVGAHAFAGFDRDEVALVAVLAFAAVYRQPARVHQHLAFGLERLAFDAGDARGDEVFGRWVEDREEALDDHVVELLLGLGKVLGRLQRRDDGEVVGDLGVVEDPLVGDDPLASQDLVRKGRVARKDGFVVPLAGAFASEHAQGVLDRAEVVFGQGAGVGPRVGQDLVFFVQRLGEAQCGLGREAEAAVGLALQAGEVVEQRRELGRGLGFLAHLAELPGALGGQRLGAGFVPETVGAQVFFFLRLALAEVLVEPLAGVFATGAGEGGGNFPVGARVELADLVLAFNNQRQGRGLHAADGGQVETAGLGVEGGHRARAVDADQPVGFGTADGGIGEAAHFGARAQGVEAVADGLRRHRLQPQAFDRLAALGVLHNVIEDQLALAARVAGVHQAADVLALDQPGQELQARLTLGDRRQVEVRRDDRQVGEGPFAALDFVFFGTGQFEQVADGRADHLVFALEVVVMLGEAAERARDVRGDGGFLGDDQLFAHGRCVELDGSMIGGPWVGAEAARGKGALHNKRVSSRLASCAGSALSPVSAGIAGARRKSARR